MGPQAEDVYRPPLLAWFLHQVPHYNITWQRVNNTFDPHSPIYLESLGILGSLPAAWLILTLVVLLIYLLTRCCDRKPRPRRSISALKVTLAIVAVLCCGAVGLGLYGNDDLHNGMSQLLAEGHQVDILVGTVRNQTAAIERALSENTVPQLTQIRDIFDEPVTNQSALSQLLTWLESVTKNTTAAAHAAADIRRPLQGINLAPILRFAEMVEGVRWPVTMAVLSALLVLCVVLLVGVARHSRCALIAFSVCGLLAVIASYLMASVYVGSTVALGDLCMAPDVFLAGEAAPRLPKEVLLYYTNCERHRANPFTLRLREAKAAVETSRTGLTNMKRPAMELFKGKDVDRKLDLLFKEVKEADGLLTKLTSSVDCRSFYTHYLRGARALCNVGLLGLALMLLSAVLSGLLLTVLVWVDSHTWIYIRKKRDYQQVNEADPFLPPPAASQAIAARTLTRSQGYPSPPSYTAVMAQQHAQPLLLKDGCDGMMQARSHHAGLSHVRGHTLGRLPSHHHGADHHGPNNGKYATLSKQCKTLESSDFY